MVFEDTVEFGRRLLRALGIPPGGAWDRIALVVDVNEGTPKVYVRGHVLKGAVALNAVVEAVQDLRVSADGDVEVLPLAEEVPATDPA